jgi:transposase
LKLPQLSQEEEQMAERLEGVAFPPTARGATAEEQMVRADLVREMVARRERGESTRQIARELAVDRETVRRWLRRGGWQPRQGGARPRALDPYLPFIERRGPEVNWNGVVLYRELVGLGFTGGYQQVQRVLKPRLIGGVGRKSRGCGSRPHRANRRKSIMASCRSGSASSGRPCTCSCLRWAIHDACLPAGIATSDWPRCSTVMSVRFAIFGGVTLSCLYDNPRTLVLGRREHKVLWHPLFEDFARYYGFTPRACQPYRARTKGKVESGVKYVKRNALAGRRFTSWEELNDWLERWSAEVADRRIHGTTHEQPSERFGGEHLTPLGARPPYRYERVRLRHVANDALVAIGAARYSVPVAYVGLIVSVHESSGYYEIFHQERLVARHPKVPRHSVRMEPAHYAGLLRVAQQSGPRPRRALIRTTVRWAKRWCAIWRSTRPPAKTREVARNEYSATRTAA